MAVAAAALLVTAGTVHSGENENLSQHILDWLSRTDGSIYIDQNGVQGEVETIQPLFMSEDYGHTFFAQGRASYADDKFTLNGGLGYRRLLPNGKWILGANAFYDVETEQYHKRLGAGFEAIGEQLTVRGNYYHGLTGWKTLSETGTTRIDTKPLDGFDFSLNGPMPYLPWLRAEATLYGWMPELIDDFYGFQGKLMAQVNQSMSFEAGYRHDTHNDLAFARVTVALGKPSEHEFTAVDTGVSSVAFTPRDLTKHTLQKVERNNEIVLETSTTTVGVTSGGVTVSRGS